MVPWQLSTIQHFTIASLSYWLCVNYHKFKPLHFPKALTLTLCTNLRTFCGWKMLCRILGGYQSLSLLCIFRICRRFEWPTDTTSSTTVISWNDANFCTPRGWYEECFLLLLLYFPWIIVRKVYVLLTILFALCHYLKLAFSLSWFQFFCFNDLFWLFWSPSISWRDP